MSKFGGKKVGVAFRKPEEPAFLRDFKKRAGYKEDSGLQDKFAELPPATARDLADDEDDLPQVVSQGRGALSGEECAALQKEGRLQGLLASGQAAVAQEEVSAGSRKVVFRSRNKQDVEATVDDRDTAALKDGHKKKKKEMRKQEEKKKKLLSFDDDDDDEEEEDECDKEADNVQEKKSSKCKESKKRKRK